MGLTAQRIGELVAELAPLLQGRVLREVAPLPPRDLLFVFDATDRADPERPIDPERPPVLRLRLSAHREACRLHLQHLRLRSHGGGTSPFFRRVAEELQGARLVRISQPRGDRLAHLEFRDGPLGPRAILAELTGRHANLVLLDRDDRVLDVLVPPPRGTADRPPRLQLGATWEPPPGRPPARGRDPERNDPEPPEPYPDSAPSYLAGVAPHSWQIEAQLAPIADEQEHDRRRRTLRDRLERRRKRARSNLAGLGHRRSAAEGADRVRADGELLKSALGEVRRGAKTVEVVDYYAGEFDSSSTAGAELPRRTLELDPKLSPADNAERYFNRARKLQRALENLPDEEERARERLAAIERVLEELAAEGADPDALEAEALAAGILEPAQQSDVRKRAAPVKRLPYRTFESDGGREIRVGRSARDNDALSFRHSRGNDYWLHTADAPGSHVILRVERGATPSEEDILDAAHLAVHFSPLREATRADVHVARCKEVRKPKGAPAGLVHLAGGRTLSLRMEANRLRGLLDRRSAGPTP